MHTELFNEKTIKRLCSNVMINQKQKSNANEWIKLLEAGVLNEETINYLKFASYVLRDILGYSQKTDIDFEKSNIEFIVKDSIGKDRLCIEVKGVKQDLLSRQARTKKEQETPLKQTWDNMGRIGSIKYGICTNYKDFILIDKSKGYNTYHKFDFLSIKNNPDKLKEFIAIFSKESIIDKEFIEKLYEKSIIEEREFTKEFYKLFHETRLMLIKEFQDNGATKDESIHFTQIFLNRLMFVFFAEDTGKLRQRLFEEKVLNILKADSVFSENTKLVCTLIKSIFQNLNEGSKRHNIFGFNGGLFREIIPDGVFFKDFRKKIFFDKIYQNSKIKNEIELDEKSKAILDVYNGNINPIIMNLLYLASFDFNTEVSVNILGHIFEQSISDLEEIKEEKSLRRKKEGVYYTPDYITEYICRNTIITYLSKKGTNIVEKLINEYSDDIEELEEKLKNLKILDPACGSGSFLLKAVEILLEIHKEIQNFKESVGEYSQKQASPLAKRKSKKLRKEQLTFTKFIEEDEAREIIENNIFGVDINEESVEITKLSLFFKIVKKNKKLIDLSENIKCGNSLISDPEITSYKAFDWEKEFPFKFDIIIGNPPWGAHFDDKSKKHLKNKYKYATTGKIDSYKYFYEKSFDLLLPDIGLISMITPNTFLYNIQSKKIRKAILDNFIIIEGIELRKNIFPDAPDVVPTILILKSNKSTSKKYKTKVKVAFPNKHITSIISNEWMIEQYLPVDVFNKDKENKINLRFNVNFSTIKEKIEKNSTLQNFFNLKQGTKIFGSKEDKPNENKFYQKNKIETGWDKAINGRNIGRYSINFENDYVLRTNKLHSILPDDIIDSVKIYFQRMRKISLFPRIVGTYDTGEFHGLYTCSVIYSKKECDLDLKYILCLINSLLINLWYKYYDTDVEIKLASVGEIPIVNLSIEKQKPFIEKAETMLNLNKKFIDNKNRFIKRIEGNLKIGKISKRLDNFYKMDFKGFLNELSKHKILLNLNQQDEWEDYFNRYKDELTKLQQQIKQTDNEINQMVYKLYGLTKEEIDIIKESLKE